MPKYRVRITRERVVEHPSITEAIRDVATAVHPGMSYVLPANERIVAVEAVEVTERVESPTGPKEQA